MKEQGLTVVKTVHFGRVRKGRKRLRDGKPPVEPPSRPPVPRETQLLAIALRFEELLASGEASSYADLARIAGVSRARVSQIMERLEMAVEEQEKWLVNCRDSSAAANASGPPG